SRTRLVVAEVIPGITVVAVILAHGAPLTFAEVRPPLFPGDRFLPRFDESLLFGGHKKLRTSELENTSGPSNRNTPPARDEEAPTHGLRFDATTSVAVLGDPGQLGADSTAPGHIAQGFSRAASLGSPESCRNNAPVELHRA